MHYCPYLLAYCNSWPGESVGSEAIAIVALNAVTKMVNTSFFIILSLYVKNSGTKVAVMQRYG
jgi:hypothetical protein